MIELLVTGLLVAGLEWSPPVGWTIDKVRGGGVPEIGGLILTPWCGPRGCPEPDRRTIVMLRRPIAAGERVELPVGCAVTAEVTK